MAYTVTYLWPIAGATAPTATQSFRFNEVSADVTKGASGDTTVDITHNWALSVAVLAAGFPEVELEPSDLSFYSALYYVSARATNSITLTAATGGGTTGANLRVRIKKPNSLEK